MGVLTEHDFATVLARARGGDERARRELIALVYEEWRLVAGRMMRSERTDHTLSPTAVVHEAVIRMLSEEVFARVEDRGFLFASAMRSMRQVLVDHARRRATDRRGGRWQRVPLDRILDDLEAQGLDVLRVHEALDRLAERNGRQARVMVLRYFGGLTVEEVAAALGISRATVEGDWRLARAWLCGQFRGDDG